MKGHEAIAEAGLPQAEPRIVPVHNHIEGRGEEGAVLVLIELDGFTTDDYDALAGEMEAHAGDGSAHPAVAHVIGATDGAPDWRCSSTSPSGATR